MFIFSFFFRFPFSYISLTYWNKNFVVDFLAIGVHRPSDPISNFPSWATFSTHGLLCTFVFVFLAQGLFILSDWLWVSLCVCILVYVLSDLVCVFISRAATFHVMCVVFFSWLCHLVFLF